MGLNYNFSILAADYHSHDFIRVFRLFELCVPSFHWVCLFQYSLLFKELFTFSLDIPYISNNFKSAGKLPKKPFIFKAFLGHFYLFLGAFLASE
jgi:hypothetical protein